MVFSYKMVFCRGASKYMTKLKYPDITCRLVVFKEKKSTAMLKRNPRHFLIIKEAFYKMKEFMEE